jgi:predicted CoA-binding protein
MVDVFRRPEFLVETTEAAVERGARAVWLQQGLVSPEAREIAEAAGLDFVEDRCTAVEVKRLLPSR